MAAAESREKRARTFFLGAGASKAAGYPLTSELIAGIANYVCGSTSVSKITKQDVMESERIRDYLFSVYGATEGDLRRVSRCWKSLRSGELSRAARRTLRSALPDLTEILSCIDILTQEDLSVGAYQTEDPARFSSRRAIDARELRSLRRSFGRALVRSFNELDSRMPERTVIDEFCSHLGPRDAVITTNWDILLDRALDRAFGTALEDYGTPVQWFADQKESKVPQRRPPLYKLHGAMNWLQCRRCQALYVDPGANVALVDFDDTAQFGTCKECSFKLTTLMVTPTFVKEYKSVHLGAVWNAALRALCESSEWVFIGYSLPKDDIHIKTMLIRAYRVWADDHRFPNILVVGRHHDDGLLQSYRHLFRDKVSMYPKDFTSYVKGGLRQAAAPRPVGAPAGALPPSGAKASAARLSVELREMEARRLARERRHAQGNGKGDHAPARLQVLH